MRRRTFAKTSVIIAPMDAISIRQANTRTTPRDETINMKVLESHSTIQPIP
jgi:hypothetical protein